jgi:hypothetical protein
MQEAPDFTGAPEEIRTPDPQIRSLMLACQSAVPLRHLSRAFLRERPLHWLSSAVAAAATPIDVRLTTATEPFWNSLLPFCYPIR